MIKTKSSKTVFPFRQCYSRKDSFRIFFPKRDFPNFNLNFGQVTTFEHLRTNCESIIQVLAKFKLAGTKGTKSVKNYYEYPSF